MKQTIKSSAADFFTGLLATLLATIVLIKTDQLTYFYAASVCFIFASGLFRGNKSSLKPAITFILLNLGFILLAIDELIKSENITVASASFPLLLISLLGIHLGKYWADESKIKKSFLTIVPMMSISIYFWIAIPTIADNIYTKETNISFNAFEFSALDGRKISTNSLKGKVVILSFGQTDSRTSQKGLLKLEATFDKYHKHTEVDFYYINTGSAVDTTEIVREKTMSFTMNNKFKIPFAYSIEGVQHYFRTYQLPTTIVIDKSGKYRFMRAGYFDERNLDKIISKDIELLLKEAAEKL